MPSLYYGTMYSNGTEFYVTIKTKASGRYVDDLGPFDSKEQALEEAKNFRSPTFGFVEVMTSVRVGE